MKSTRPLSLRAQLAQAQGELTAVREERDVLVEKNRLLVLQHAKSGHDMDTAGHCDADCSACGRLLAQGRTEGLKEALSLASESKRGDLIRLLSGGRIKGVSHA